MTEPSDERIDGMRFETALLHARRREPFAVESLNDRTAWVPRDWNRVSEDTGIGNPLKSSPEKGARYAEAVVYRLVRLFADLAAPDGIYGERRPETDRF